uniref:B12-binding domain-containing radical SAM protein n=1 Tax=Geoglobus ahangari TaxID=113653 RepID=A0A7C4W3X3_9EURY
MNSEDVAEIVLTAPATEMSTHHGKEFLGFGTCTPPSIVPGWFVRLFFYPKVENENGLVRFAPYGLRKVEAALIESGLNVVTVHPYDIGKYLDKAKVVGVSVMDPLGFGPVSVTFSSLLGGTPSTRLEFIRLMEKLRPFKDRVRIIIGGPGSWQLKWDEYWKNFVDCIVIGEAEEIVPDLFRKALSGESLPKVVYCGGPDVEKIPTIKNPSVNGLVEVSRGCGRGCRFCSETLKGRRDIPLSKILEEVRLNVKGGTKGVILHAEDVLLYGCKSPKFIPDEEKVIKLFKAVKTVTDNVGISHCSLAAVSSKPALVEEINNILDVGGKIQMFGVQTGVETGSPRIMEKYMRGKCLPFSPNEWCDVVEQAFAIMHDNLWVPAATLLIGLSGETEDDIVKTIELVERLRDYRSLIVPLIFIPMEVCALRKEKMFAKENLRETHWELLIACVDHNIHWVDDLKEKYLTGFKNIPIKLGYQTFALWVKRAWKRRREEILRYARNLEFLRLSV